MFIYKISKRSIYNMSSAVKLTMQINLKHEKKNKRAINSD